MCETHYTGVVGKLVDIHKRAEKLQTDDAMRTRENQQLGQEIAKLREQLATRPETHDAEQQTDYGIDEGRVKEVQRLNYIVRKIRETLASLQNPEVNSKISQLNEKLSQVAEQHKTVQLFVRQ